MSKVALRVYNREIETLVDQGHIEEAIAHCQHILKVYPKHLETYRLLGKAYLEAHRHVDAADIFQRVLVAVPDDFISHLGMSLVRDEQKDMDGAIWHMERAFEVNPSNGAVQGELRRLYGRRDGLEPPKIRLTRGALAHMYTKGGQYQQAVAEIKSVLAEDATRNDMKVLMARAFYRAGQKVEATEICIDLLKQFPYCLDANRILVEVLPGTSLSQSMDTYKKRVQALEPYAATATTSIFEIESVPDNAITLERLEWDPGSISPQDSFAGSSAQSGEQLPDFLRTSGWGPSTGEFQEGHVDFSADEPADAASSGLAAAEIPDWLKAMAPPGSAAQPDATDKVSDQNLEPADLDWLSGLGGPVSGSQFPADTQAQSIAPTASDDQPDWMKDLGGFAVDQPPAEPASSGAQPDWMKELGEVTPTGETAPAAEDGLDWLQTMSASQDSPASQPENLAAQTGSATADEMDWLKDLGAPVDASVSNIPSSQPDTTPTDDMDWLKGLGVPAATSPATDAPISDTPISQPSSTPAEDTDWLAGLSASSAAQTPVSGTSVPQPDAMPSDDMDWLAGLGVPAAASAADTPTSGTSISQPDETPSGDMDWLKNLGQPATESESQPASTQDTDWLKNLGEPAGTPVSSIATSQPDAAPTDELDWLKGPEQPTDIPATTAPVADTSPSQPNEASADNMDWLKGLGIPTDSAPETAATPTTEVSASQTGTAPTDEMDWLKNLGEPAETTPISETSSAQPDTAPVNDIDWLNSLGQPKSEDLSEPVRPVETAAVAPPSQDKPEAKVPKDLSGDDDIPPLSAPVSGPGTSDMDQDDAMKWLESLAQKQGAKAEELITNPGERTETAPDWVAKVDEAPAASAEPTAPPKFASEDQDAAPDELSPLIASAPGITSSEQDDAMKWLESLAEKQGAKPEELITNPTERTETAPGWVDQVQNPAADVSAGQDNSMDWLENLAGQQDAKPAEPVTNAAEPADAAPDWLQSGIPASTDQPTIVQKRPMAQDDPNFVPGPLSELVSGPGTSASEQDDAMKWLESLAEKQGAKSEELITNPGERTDEAPAWATQPVAAQPPAEIPPPPPAVSQPTIVQKPMAQDDPNFVPGPLSELVSGPGTSASEQDDAMKWLESLAEKQGAKSEELITNPGERTDEAPAWATQASTQPVAAQPPVVETPPPPPAVSQPTIVQKPMAQDDPNFVPGPLSELVSGPGTSASEQDDAMKWLESLAEKQGAKSEELITNPGERTDEAPAWATQASTQPVAAQPPVETPPPPPAEVEPAATQDDDTMAWLQGLGVDKSASTTPAEASASEPVVGSMSWEQEETPIQPTAQYADVPSEEMPWEQAVPAAPVIEESAPIAAPEPSNDVSEWLKNLDVPDQRPPAAAAEDLPQWLNAEPVPAVEDELPEWLKDQSADEQPPATTPAPTWVPDSPVDESPAITATPAAGDFESAPLIYSPPLETPPALSHEVVSFDAPPAAPEPVPASTRVPITPVQPPPPVRPAVRQTGMLGDKDGPALQNARHQMAHGGLEAAVNGYTKLIKRGKFLEEVIYDLKEATYTHPVDVIVWQTLGDAHMRANQLQEALDAYTKAEELLR